MRIKALVLAAGGAVALSGVAQAQNVLIYEELVLGSSAYTEAVSQLGWSSTYISDGFAFEAALQGPDLYTHVIVAHQNTFAAGTWEDDLVNWATANPDRPILISDWRVNNPQPYLAALGFSYTGNTNLFNVAGVAGSVLDGKAAALVSPGWGIFSYGVAGGDIVATDTPGTGKGMVAQNGAWFFNGFLSDDFGGSQDGVDIVINELTVPAPGALALLGLAGIAGRRRRR
jgi:hypothetical protein